MILKFTSRYSITAKAVMAVQALHEAQTYRLPMEHAMALYEDACVAFNQMTAYDFEMVLIAVFLLCLCMMAIPNNDKATLSSLSEEFVIRLAESLRSRDLSPLAQRLCSWLQTLTTVSKRTGSPSLLPRQVSETLQKYCSRHIPCLAARAEKDIDPEGSSYDLLSEPVIEFHRHVQEVSSRAADLLHYHRSRTTVEDQTEASEVASRLEAEMQAMWEHRPWILRLSFAQLRGHFAPSIAEPLKELCGLCVASYFAEIVALGRIISDHPFPTPDAEEAKSQIRAIVEECMSGTSLSPSFTRPMF